MKRLLYVIPWLVALVVIAGAMLIFESELLWKVQEMNLFLTTSLFFKQQMVVAGGLLTWLGTFFTQFFFHPWIGTLMLCGLWFLLMWLTKRTFRLSPKWTVSALVPVALLLVANMDQGYWVYVLKLRGYFFIPTLGTTAMVALLWGWRNLPQRYSLPTAAIILTAAIGYPLLGIYGLAATLLMGVWTWRLHKGSQRIVNSVVAVLSTVAVPLLYYRYIYYQTHLDNIYWAAMPVYNIDKPYLLYYIPYGLLLLFFLAMAVIKTDNKEVKTEKKLSLIIYHLSLITLLTAGVAFFWYKDDNFHRELRMQQAIEQTDWNSVLKESTYLKEEPTRAIVMMRNLALARLNRQSTEMYSYRNGQQRPNAPFMPHLMQTIGAMLYYQYGLTNYSYRLGMELGVEYGWRAGYLKLMAKNALLNGEKQVVRKYTRQLKHTLFFGEWAEQLEKLIGDQKELMKSPELNPIAHMMRYAPDLTSDDGNIEGFLMKNLANTLHEDPYFQEQALIASMWIKRSDYFWPQFKAYLQLHTDQPVPRYFQEAALLFAIKDKRSDIDQMPFDPGIKPSFQRFMELSQQYEGRDVADVQKALYSIFGDTYFFDYFLMKILPQ